MIGYASPIHYSKLLNLNAGQTSQIAQFTADSDMGLYGYVSNAKSNDLEVYIQRGSDIILVSSDIDCILRYPIKLAINGEQITIYVKAKNYISNFDYHLVLYTYVE